MNELALYSTPQTVDPGIMLSVDLDQKIRTRSAYNGCRADYAENFNYVIVSGDLKNQSAVEKLKILYDRIQGHFSRSQKLSVYFRVTSFDLEAVSVLLKMCKWISFVHQRGEDIQVFWETAPDNLEVRELGKDFAEFCGLGFTIR